MSSKVGGDDGGREMTEGRESVPEVEQNSS